MAKGGSGWGPGDLEGDLDDSQPVVRDLRVTGVASAEAVGAPTVLREERYPVVCVTPRERRFSFVAR